MYLEMHIARLTKKTKKLTNMVEYYIDRINIKTAYGVYVSASTGLFGRPKPITLQSTSWAGYHGEVVDLRNKHYESREIILDCFIKANSKADFILKCNNFLSIFDTKTTKRLQVVIEESEPLDYEVYLSADVEIKKRWSDGDMTGTFSLRLREPEPVKRIIKYTRTGDPDKTASITVSSPKLLNIYWGDGSHTFDVVGTAQTKTHTYAANGTYYIVVTGNIEEITSLTTTGTVVWNKL